MNKWLLWVEAIAFAGPATIFLYAWLYSLLGMDSALLVGVLSSVTSELYAVVVGVAFWLLALPYFWWLVCRTVLGRKVRRGAWFWSALGASILGAGAFLIALRPTILAVIAPVFVLTAHLIRLQQKLLESDSVK